MREFDQWVALSQRAQYAMIFLNAYEAEAYCRWAHRRLPTEAEWEYGAKRRDAERKSDSSGPTMSHRTDSALQSEYQVWEWTSDAFQPYPGFKPGPYVEYSAPWFHDHRVLRGGCYVTQSRLLRPTYRNFYTPDRRDVLAGFRTCAAERR
jgi:iron(II)-dependent oxidoreductase